ncbi:MAG: hypothetical protein GF331_08460 [Chitinivibrionales bacterium]|nr:hypothetical protein [Chitinivibrionales bacterium]
MTLLRRSCPMRLFPPRRIAIPFALLVSLIGCVTQERTAEPTPSVISAHTSGTISRESVIKVRFTERVADSSRINVPLDRSPLSFKPGIDGIAVFADDRTLEFRPAKRLPQQQEYTARLKLSDILQVEPDQEVFEFTFSTMAQYFDVELDGLRAISRTDLTQQQLRGSIVTADAELSINVEKVLSVTQEKRALPIQWSHSSDRREHGFVVDSIVRGKDSSSVLVQWNGAPIEVDKEGERVLHVPALGEFHVSQIRSVQGKQDYIEVRFTDPLERKQNLQGLIRIANHSGLRFDIDDNLVKVYSRKKWIGTLEVRVEPGVRNVMGIRLKEGESKKVTFEDIKPQVRFVGKGVIMPTSDNLTVPIEAVNVRAVIVEAVRIYEDNMSQFLQVNTLTGSDELNRVGRAVWKKLVPLGWTSSARNEWKRYGLDVAPLIKQHPRGLYRLKLSFIRRHAVYQCAGDSTSPAGDAELELQNVDDELESSYWDNAERDYDWYEYYQNRENPCHPAYYRPISGHDISVSRNVIVSDIGMVAKRGASDTVLVVVTDLRTAQPMVGAAVTLLDYQQGVLAQGNTDRQGMVRLAADRKAFLAVAENGGQKGYLRLGDGDALSVSHFDVGGETVRKGLKGYLYGERGVWRPGDSLFVTFVLMDRGSGLPPDHPVRFELYNARGQKVRTINRTRSKHGFHAFRIGTDPDAPTGNWRAAVRVGGVTFEKVLKVESIMPNRLKIRFELPQGTDYLTDGHMSADLSATWLHGAVARNLKADVEVNFSPARTKFAKLNDYVFDNPVRQYDPEKQAIFDGSLDGSGHTVVSANLRAYNSAPGMLTAGFRTRVYEPSGAFSVDRFSIPFHPYDRYVGVRVPKGDKARGMLLTDTTHTVRIAVVDRDGKPVPARKLEVTLYKVRWRWWWEKGDESLADYVGRSSHKPIKADTIKAVNGKAQWPFKIKYPAWGRYLVRVRDLDGGHATGKLFYVDWPGWAGRARKDSPGGATVLSFSTDKQEYQVGEKATVTIPTGTDGRALVTVESGTGVLAAEWIEPKGEQTRYSFTCTGDMAPNVYVHVSYVQPHLQTKNDHPIRMYGVVPVKVVDPNTVLQPELDCPETFVPEETATVTVSEQSGSPMTYTLAIVDEGLLDLTRFATPDPWAHFYRREALGVMTWDVFDEVIGAYGGSLERLLSIGGDGAAAEPGKKKAQRFPPMVRFYGPFDLGKRDKNTHEVDIPQYVGAVRVMVVAGRDGAFGKAEQSVFVRKPLMILGTLPRVLGPEEQVDLPVAVFAMEPKVKNVSVQIKTDGPLSVVGDSRKKVSFDDVGDELVTFTLKASGAPGIASVSIDASGGGEKATHDIELDIRMPGGPVVDVIDTVLGAGDDWQGKVTLPGMAGTNEAYLEVSRVPPLNLARRLKWLIRYPHGCVEQTTSSVFPQVYLPKLVKLSPEREEQVTNNVKAGIDRLRTFQTSDGGFGYWPGGNSCDWGSNYAGHFLVEARKSGYVVPDAIVDQWKKYQQNRAANWTSGGSGSDLTQAYRLYTLALAGSADLSAMNRFKETKDLSSPAAWRLAAAYHLAGQPEAAKRIARQAGLKTRKYRELGGTYGSGLRDTAMIVEALGLLGEHEKAQPLIRAMSERLCSEKWLSTQTTAYALIAMARLAGMAQGEELRVAYSWNGGREQTVSANAAVLQQTLSVGDMTDAEIAVRNAGSGIVYPRLVVEGIPAPGKETAAENGIKLIVHYLTPGGSRLDVSELEQGTDFVAEITVRNTGRSGLYEEIALSHLVASGWEIRNDRMEPGSGQKQSDFENQDIRDDRVYTYFDINQGKSKTYRVMLNAAYLGRFYLPMLGVEAMYDATINARVPGQWVNVVKAGQAGN